MLNNFPISSNPKKDEPRKRTLPKFRHRSLSPPQDNWTCVASMRGDGTPALGSSVSGSTLNNGLNPGLNQKKALQQPHPALALPSFGTQQPQMNQNQFQQPRTFGGFGGFGTGSGAGGGFGQQPKFG